MRYFAVSSNRLAFVSVAQHASKFAKFEIGCAKRTLERSCDALPLLLGDGYTKFMETVVMLFDPSRTIYMPMKTMWSTSPGSPEASLYM